jgi:L-2-hydroxycarboxylate dehydrogenase (NAD+)
MVELNSLPKGTGRFPAETMFNFAAAVFRAKGHSDEDARLSADVLISADLWGIRSHGIARLPKFVDLFDSGAIKKDSDMTFQAGSDTTGVLDADNGSGIIAANRAMAEVLSMTERHGTGFVAVCNSNHFAFPGYWAQRAAHSGFLGICLSTGGYCVTPTFAMEPILGTNPMSIAIPGGAGDQGFYMDMATSVVARGKIETSLREGRSIPKGWVPESYGELRLDDNGILTFDVPLLPLGGEGTETGGHKGYALSLMVELLCSILGGRINHTTGHFMGAINIAGFREPALVHAQMQEIFEVVRNAKKVPGHDRVYIPGELEHRMDKENRRLGIPITRPVMEQIRRLNRELDLGFKF